MKAIILILILISTIQSNKLLNMVRRLNDAQPEPEPEHDDEPEDEPVQPIEETEQPETSPKLNVNDEMFDLGPLTDPNAQVHDDRVIYVTSFEKLMHIGSTVNHYYNLAINLSHQEENEDIRDSYQAELETFEATKELLTEVTFNKEELENEVEKLYHDIDIVKMTPEEAFKFFGFYEKYKEVVASISTRSPEYEKINNELVELVDDYNDKMRGFFKGIYNLRHLEVFFANMANPHREKYLKPLDDIEKISLGEKMADILIGFGDEFYSQFENMGSALELNDSFRAKLFNIIDELGKLVPDLDDLGNNYLFGVMKTGLIGVIAAILIAI